MVRGLSTQQMRRGYEKVKGDLIVVFCYLMDSHREEARLLKDNR